MSETMKPGASLQESGIAKTPEQADNAATTKLSYEQPVEETTENLSVNGEESANTGSRPASRQEVIERLQQIAESDDVLNCKAEVESLKMLFYKMRTIEIEEERKAFVENGGEENVFIPAADVLEEAFKAAMNSIKKNRIARNSPKGIWANMKGNVTNTRPGPSAGEMPNENTAGIIASPAIMANNVSVIAVWAESPTIFSRLFT